MPDSPPSFGSQVFKWSVCALCWLFFLGMLLFPANLGEGENASHANVKNDISQIVAAVKTFYIEYGKWPPVGQNGLVDSPEDQARLFQILEGKDVQANPRKIVFFEVHPARKKGWWGQRILVAGFTPGGVLLDPWGNPYRIAFDADFDNKVKSPYEDQQAASIRSWVIVWSLGKDGVQSPWLHKESRRADDIVSWE